MRANRQPIDFGRHLVSLIALALFCFLAAGSFDTGSDSPSGGSYTKPAARTDPKDAVRGRLSLEFSWSKKAFGNVMEAHFTVTNQSDYTIKDIEITCTHFAPSGTKIDSNTRTIYEVVGSRSSRNFRNFNMGFIHSQAKSSSCRITDFIIVRMDRESGTTSGDSASDPIVKETQSLLNKLNYQAGVADGIMGPKTTAAIKQFQKEAGLPETGKVSADLLFELRKRN